MLVCVLNVFVCVLNIITEDMKNDTEKGKIKDSQRFLSLASVFQNNGFAGARGEQRHRQGAWGWRQLDPDQEVWFSCCPTHF